MIGMLDTNIPFPKDAAVFRVCLSALVFHSPSLAFSIRTSVLRKRTLHAVLVSGLIFGLAACAPPQSDSSKSTIPYTVPKTGCTRSGSGTAVAAPGRYIHRKPLSLKICRTKVTPVSASSNLVKDFGYGSVRAMCPKVWHSANPGFLMRTSIKQFERTEKHVSKHKIITGKSSMS